jgi:tetratricopeptide (TPR) repeat protein
MQRSARPKRDGPTRASSAPPQPASSRWETIGLIALVLILTAPFIYLQRGHHALVPGPEPELHFVGSKRCAECHQSYYDSWQGSHHDLAMDKATEETVLGDFSGVTYSDPNNQVTSRFFKQDGKFMVETEGPDGKPGTFQITYTFGVYPLQQYLIPFPGGRLQCLNIAWDARQNLWYRLPPYDVEGTDDWLHWTRGGQTWNGMCAECHSTNVEKHFDIASNTYQTSWYEIDVGCEACHGPGSRHAAWAAKPPLARTVLDNDGLAVATSGITSKEQIALCAPCHSRRFQLGDNDHRQGDVLDSMVPSLLEEGLYYPDGQILEEVYVYGSFVQSKMYRHEVRCSDCHDMHSLTLHKEGNDLCLQCHRAEEYDRYDHHFHQPRFEGRPSEGYLCVKCHMPGRTYMGIDYRPDHSLRVPRPDLSVSIGTPNSCSTADCHGDKPLSWVNDHYQQWYGKARKPHYGEIIAAARSLNPGAEKELQNLSKDTLIPVIVRATALSLLRNYPDPLTTRTLVSGLDDEDSLIRYTAIRGLGRLDSAARLHYIAPKLYDPVKAVRIEAAAALASVPTSSIKADDIDAFTSNLEAYRQAMLYNSDFAPQRYNLGNLAAAQGDEDGAIAYYRQAIKIDDQFYPAKVNLAMALNRRGDNRAAEKLLREVVKRNPQLGEVRYSLGLLLAEMENYEEAASMLGSAADNMPSYSRPRYNQALALLKLKRYEDGEQALLKALEVEPENSEYFSTLANLYLNFGMIDRAEQLARTILEKVPDHRAAAQLLELIEQNRGASQANP